MVEVLMVGKGLFWEDEYIGLFCWVINDYPEEFAVDGLFCWFGLEYVALVLEVGVVNWLLLMFWLITVGKVGETELFYLFG